VRQSPKVFWFFFSKKNIFLLNVEGTAQHSQQPAKTLVDVQRMLTLWAATAFALASPLQMRVVDEAVDAQNLVATVNQGAFNLGNAGGAWLGGLTISAGWSYRDLPLVSTLVTVLAVAVTGLSMWLERAPIAAIAL
jgi:predicted MFS family arabinose efflux permease